MAVATLFADFQSYAESLIDRHQIPAVSLAVLSNNQCYSAAAGILNIDTGVEANTDSIFQIGSITKVFTTSLIMQLVDEGRVDLDTPVKLYLRDFQIADIQATQNITVRQLLNHTNGIAGDYFADDCYAEGNAIARYLDRINLLPLVHSPGKNYSYSNAAFTVAGRLVEVILGCSWHQAIEERIFRPLGMKQAIADPTETLRFRAAIGHLQDTDSPQAMAFISTLLFGAGASSCTCRHHTQHDSNRSAYFCPCPSKLRKNSLWNAMAISGFDTVNAVLFRGFATQQPSF